MATIRAEIQPWLLAVMDVAGNFIPWENRWKNADDVIPMPKHVEMVEFYTEAVFMFRKWITEATDILEHGHGVEGRSEQTTLLGRWLQRQVAMAYAVTRDPLPLTPHLVAARTLIVQVRVLLSSKTRTQNFLMKMVRIYHSVVSHLLTACEELLHRELDAWGFFRAIEYSPQVAEPSLALPQFEDVGGLMLSIIDLQAWIDAADMILEQGPGYLAPTERTLSSDWLRAQVATALKIIREWLTDGWRGCDMETPRQHLNAANLKSNQVRVLLEAQVPTEELFMQTVGLHRQVLGHLSDAFAEVVRFETNKLLTQLH